MKNAMKKRTRIEQSLWRSHEISFPFCTTETERSSKAWLKYRDTGLAFAIELNKDLRSYGNVVVADYKATVVEREYWS